jgi:hypothetical protein
LENNSADTEPAEEFLRRLESIIQRAASFLSDIDTPVKQERINSSKTPSLARDSGLNTCNFTPVNNAPSLVPSQATFVQPYDAIGINTPVVNTIRHNYDAHNQQVVSPSSRETVRPSRLDQHYGEQDSKSYRRDTPRRGQQPERVADRVIYNGTDRDTRAPK